MNLTLPGKQGIVFSYIILSSAALNLFAEIAFWPPSIEISASMGQVVAALVIATIGRFGSWLQCIESRGRELLKQSWWACMIHCRIRIFSKDKSYYVQNNREELCCIDGATDFFGVYPYTATVTYAPTGWIDACAGEYSINNTLFPFCVAQERGIQYGWRIDYRSESYVYITPTYFREYLFYLWDTFKKPIPVSEFGFPVYGDAGRELVDQLSDSPRSTNYLSYMSEILKCIWEGGVHVLGAIAWSIFDNWELEAIIRSLGYKR